MRIRRSLIPGGVVLSLVASGCGSPPAVAPPPVTVPARPASVVPGTVDPIARGDSRRSFDGQAPVRAAASEPAASSRPSALPMFDATLPANDPMAVAAEPKPG